MDDPDQLASSDTMVAFEVAIVTSAQFAEGSPFNVLSSGSLLPQLSLS